MALKKPRDFDLQKLKTFHTIVNLGSFSKAAKALSIKQPAISLQMKLLCDIVGAKQLFYRVGKGVKPTDEGKALNSLISPILDNISDLKNKFMETYKKHNGEVKIATHDSVMTYILPDIVKTFKKSHPECRLSIVSRSKPDILALISDGTVDIGITSRPPKALDLDYKLLKKYDRVLIAQKGHPLSKKSTIEPKDLIYPLLMPPLGSNTRAEIDRVFREKGLEYMVAMEIAGREAAKTYAEMGIGISIINEYCLSDSDKKRLLCKNVSDYFGTAERGIVTKNNRYLSHPAREFIDMLLLRFKTSMRHSVR